MQFLLLFSIYIPTYTSYILIPHTCTHIGTNKLHFQKRAILLLCSICSHFLISFSSIIWVLLQTSLILQSRNYISSSRYRLFYIHKSITALAYIYNTKGHNWKGVGWLNSTFPDNAQEIVWCSSVRKMHFLSQWDGSAGRSTSLMTRVQFLDPTVQDEDWLCALTATCMPWHPCPYVCTHWAIMIIIIIIINNFVLLKSFFSHTYSDFGFPSLYSSSPSHTSPPIRFPPFSVSHFKKTGALKQVQQLRALVDLREKENCGGGSGRNGGRGMGLL